MIIFPTPLFARDGRYRGAMWHFAIGKSFYFDGGIVKTRHAVRVSKNGDKWYPVDLQGDLQYATSAANAAGAFQPSNILRFKGKFYLFGSLWRSVSVAESAVYSSRDLVKWTKETTAYETANSGFGQGFVGAAANNNYMAAVKPTGELIWFDGTTWSGRNDLPLTGTTQKAYAITATNGGFVIAGILSTGMTAVISATTPAGTWAARTHPFNVNAVTMAAAGNVALLFARYNTTYSAQQLISAPLSDLTTWSNVSFIADRSIDVAFYGGGRWFAGGSNGVTPTWVSSTSGESGWVDANAPWGASSSRPRSGYFDGSAWWVHWGNGLLSKSTDGTTWTQLSNTGLATENYLAAYVGA